MSKAPVIGEIYLMQFDGIKNEQRGWRPGVVFQNNTGNMYSPNIIALPLTSSKKHVDMPTHVSVRASRANGLKVDSVVLCENLQCVSKDRMGYYIGRLSDTDMSDIAIASILATSAISFVDPSMLMSIWIRSTKLNSAKG